MNNLPKTLLSALKKDPIIEEKLNLHPRDLKSTGRIYAFAVSDKLIEEVGRWSELHKTDFLISWDTLIESIKTNDEGIYYFGIRKYGVDHNCYVFCNLREHKNDYSYSEHYYRKLYAVEFHRRNDEKTSDYIPVDIYLKDMTGLRYNPDDDDFNVDDVDKER